MKNKERKLILTLLIFLSLSATLPQSVVASNVTVGTLNYLETKLFQVPGNITLIYFNSDTGRQDVTVTNLGYVSSTNKTVIQVTSLNISSYVNWTFLNNTKAYRYLNPFSNNTYVISVNYASIVVPKSPAQILQNMLNMKNATLARMTGNFTNLTRAFNNMKRNDTILKNEMVNLSSEMNETRANNTPLHMEIMNLSSEIDRLGTENIAKRNAIVTANTTISNREDTIEELMNTWCTGYTYKDDGYIYINSASMAIAFLISALLLIVFIYRKKIKDKGKETLKNTLKTTSQSNQDTTGFIDEEVNSTEKDFLRDERRKEKEDEIIDLKKKDPESFKKLHATIDNLDSPAPQTNTQKQRKTEHKNTAPIEYPD